MGTRLLIAAALVLLLPLAGATAMGKPLAAYLQFPPKTPDVPHAPFSLPVFLGLTVLILAATAPLLLRLIASGRKDGPRKPAIPFPRWGWAGAALGAASWFLAWSRFPWMGGFQAHTFTPLWIAFILLVNAFTVRRTGRCLMLSQTRRFLLLFPVSAVFWWSFEYLNRFVGNWRYVGVTEFGAVEYFLFATLPFSTVLPAVLSTRELLLSFPRFDGAFREWRPLSPAPPHFELRADGVPPMDVAKGAIRSPRWWGTPAAGKTGGTPLRATRWWGTPAAGKTGGTPLRATRWWGTPAVGKTGGTPLRAARWWGTPAVGKTGGTTPRRIGLAALLLSCAGLFAVGIVPDVAFPLVWLAPAMLLISLAALRGQPHALSGIACGDWRPAVSSAFAALLCGFFWETWNFGSYAKWVYDIPYVNTLHVFEMPLLGYGGYLPFGVLCAETGDSIVGFDREEQKKIPVSLRVR